MTGDVSLPVGADPAHRRFDAGSTVVLREVWRGLTWSERPAHVVEDSNQLLVLWVPAGTSWRSATDPEGSAREATRAERFVRRMTTCEWQLGDFETDLGALWLLRPDRWHALIAGSIDGAFVGWYVNLQEPYRRTPGAVETMDLALDLLVAPDGTWNWKDEDELEALVQASVLPRSFVETLRSEALAVVADHAAGRFPFDAGWDSWQPDARMTVEFTQHQQPGRTHTARS